MNELTSSSEPLDSTVVFSKEQKEPLPPAPRVSPTPAALSAAKVTSSVADRIHGASGLPAKTKAQHRRLQAGPLPTILEVTEEKTEIKEPRQRAHAVVYLSTKSKIEGSKASSVEPQRPKDVLESMRKSLDLSQKRENQLKPYFSKEQIRNLSEEILKQGKKWIEDAKKAGMLIVKQIRQVPSALVNVDQSGKILVYLIHKGQGAFKTVSLEMEFFNAELFAHAREKVRGGDFEKEVYFMTLFTHDQGIVHFHALTEQRGTRGILMEYFDKGDLSHLIQERAKKAASSTDQKQIKQEYAEQVDSTITIMKGLRAIHVRGLVHNDIKPGNIMVGQGKIAIGDLGEVSRPGDECLCGSPNYMPPELLRYIALDGKSRNSDVGQLLIRQLGKPKDIWAMGITLYEYFFPQETLTTAARQRADGAKREIVYPRMPSPNMIVAGSQLIFSADALKQFEDDMAVFYLELDTLAEQIPSRQPIIALIKSMLQIEPKARVNVNDVLSELRKIQASLS